MAVDGVGPTNSWAGMCPTVRKGDAQRAPRPGWGTGPRAEKSETLAATIPSRQTHPGLAPTLLITDAGLDCDPVGRTMDDRVPRAARRVPRGRKADASPGRVTRWHLAPGITHDVGIGLPASPTVMTDGGTSSTTALLSTGESRGWRAYALRDGGRNARPCPVNTHDTDH